MAVQESQSIQEILRTSLDSFIGGISDFLPTILGAIIILLVGWIAAKIVKAAVGRGLTMIKFPVLADKAGIDGFLEKGGVKRTSTDLLAVLVYWLVMLIALLMAVNTLQLEVASELLNRFVLFIPKIIAAVIVIVVGLYAAGFVAAMVRTAAANAGIEEAEFVGGLARYGLIIFVFAIALNMLGIGEQIVANGFLVLFGAACLAAALAVGLGGRETVARYLQRRFGNQ